MLIGLREALDYAETNNCGIAAINTPTLELLLGTVKVAERYNVPLVVQHAQVHEPVNSIEDIGPVMVELARRSSALIVVHVDHGETYEYVERGFAVGFNSAMFDGSRLPYDDNVEQTRAVVRLANERGFGVEVSSASCPAARTASNPPAPPTRPCTPHLRTPRRSSGPPA